ncbi:MAG: hypothetical protein WDO68_20340 [Gammaproteobacteria bacterium]
MAAHAAAMSFALTLILSLALAGCDSQPASTASTAASKSNAARKAAPGGGDADMVAAFSATRGQPGLVDLKFKLAKRPAVGEPVEIDLALIPSVPLERLFARFQAAEGLQIVSGAESEHFERPAKGASVSHKLTVTAKTDGIFYVTAIVLADSDTESVARTFSIPLIAGQGLAELPAAPAAASVADPKRAPARP